jgi:hypothetical protein
LHLFQLRKQEAGACFASRGFAGQADPGQFDGNPPDPTIPCRKAANFNLRRCCLARRMQTYSAVHAAETSEATRAA